MENVNNDSGSVAKGWAKLLVTPEGRILVAGFVLTAISIFSILLTAIWDPPMSRMMSVLAFSNITVGRAVSMSIGYAAGYDHPLVLSVNMVTETILVLLFYPIFVFSIRKLVFLSALKSLIERTHEAAKRHEKKVRKYGVIGLFAFVWFPFWMTGPVVGSALGYLLRFPAWMTLVAVLTGTYIAMVAWALFLFDIQEKAAAWGRWAPAAVVAFLAAVLLAGFLISGRKNRIH